MYYIYLRHFCSQKEAEDALDSVQNSIEKVWNSIKVLDSSNLFADIETDTPNTYTLLVQIHLLTDTIDVNYTLLLDLLSKDYFTCITSDYATKLALKLSTTKQKTENDKYQIKNDIILNYPEEEEEGYEPLIRKLIILSNYFYNLKKFHNRGINGFLHITQLDQEIQNNEEYQWKLPKVVNDEVLDQIETWLEQASKNYYLIAANHNLILTHTKNIKNITTSIEERYKKTLNIQTFTVLSDEFELKYLNSQAVYERIKDLKDISLGKIETQKMDQNTQLQKELITIQKYSNTIQKSTIIIELFIVYAYTFHIWEVINKHGLESSPTLLKFIVPLIVAIGVVLFIEFILELLNKEWLQIINEIPEKLRIFLFFIISVIMILGGILYIIK